MTSCLGFRGSQAKAKQRRVQVRSEIDVMKLQGPQGPAMAAWSMNRGYI
jgi:hypothetical protein